MVCRNSARSFSRNGVVGTLEPFKGSCNVTCARLQYADVKCKGVPVIPATETLLQVLLKKPRIALL